MISVDNDLFVDNICPQMQRGFTKLFNTIVASTIWQEDNETRIVWITMLAISDCDGVVSASLPGLASLANVPLAAAERAIGKLLKPDKYSRTRDNEGRRISEVDGGWLVLNYLKYRRMLSTEERKEYKAIKQRQYRERDRDSVDKSGQCGNGGQIASASSSSSKSRCSQKEAEEFCVSIGLPRSDGEAMFLHWEEKGWGKVKDWKLTIRKWKSFGYMPSQKKTGAGKPNRTSEPYRVGERLPPPRDVSEEELSKHRQLAKNEVQLLRKKLRHETD